jgi:hypothetical protein
MQNKLPRKFHQIPTIFENLNISLILVETAPLKICHIFLTQIQHIFDYTSHFPPYFISKIQLLLFLKNKLFSLRIPLSTGYFFSTRVLRILSAVYLRTALY